MATYKALLTTAGAAKIAAATAGGTQVKITRMAVGDGGGKLPTPDPKQAKLVNEVYRANLNRLSIDAKNSNYLVAELVIQPDVGGFWMREMGLYDADGVLIAVSNMAESYKPKLAEGSGRLQTLRMVLIVSEIESVALSIDGSTVMATKDYVDDKLTEHEKSRNHPDGTTTAKGFVQLNSSVSSASETLAATPKAVKAANDNANTRVPSTRKVNNKPLTADITLLPADVGAFSNTLPIVDNTKVTRLTDPSLVAKSGAVTLAGYFDDHPLGGKPNQAADTLVTFRRAYNAGAAVTQYLHSTNGTIYVRTGAVSAAEESGWLWKQAGATTLPFGWRKVFDSANPPTAADVGALASTGGVVTGEIKGTSAVFSGSLTQRENIVGYRQLISRRDAFSAYTTYNRLDQVEGVRPSSVIAVGDITARLTTAAGDPYGRILAGVSFQYNTTGGGRLVLNARNDAGLVKSSITLDGDTSNTTIAGDVDFNGLVKFNRHDAACQFSSANAVHPLMNVSYSNAGNFGFWDATNGKWALRKRASNLTDGTADNWVMDGGLEVTGSYGLTLSTALPVSSGGTGAKTAADAVKNLGALPANGTAVAATKLATARKIAGVAFDGTKDINLTNSSVGLGNVGNFAAVQQGGGVGMGTNKIYIGWTGAKVKIQVDASDMGEVYTTQNKPPFVDAYSKTESNAHYIARDSVKTAGFASGNVANPYMRHEASDVVVYLADRNWSDSRFVYDVQRGSQALENAGWTAQQNWEAPTGCFMTGLNIRPDMGDCRMMGKYYRALMIRSASGSWRQVGN
ncbi:phage tail protein [Rahnella rivi]|uniref:phage tail protein n=1 Tax=Rahnella rivi TaxID=2816249 RepID=UPI001EE50738|nr:phage tail protein [Rahnella rivi]